METDDIRMKVSEKEKEGMKERNMREKEGGRNALGWNYKVLGRMSEG